MSKEIKLNHGKTAIVDDSDYEWLSQYEWKVVRGNRTCYAYRKGTGKNIMMHREILSATSGVPVDHANLNGLDNRRSNIRLCTNSQNQANREKSERNKSGYKGVVRQNRRWIASLNKNKKHIRIGSFHTAEEAARAYDEAARKYHGEFAHTNF